VVQKSATADLVEGGVSGAIDVITRRPLDFKNKLTPKARCRPYNDLAGKTEPQFSGLVNWKNDTTPWGSWCRASRKNQVRRDGQEILGYTAIADKAAAKAHPDLVGVLAPTFIGASLFEQKKTREGGAFDVEFKPSKELTLDLNGFYSQLKAPHQNTNWLAAPATRSTATDGADRLHGQQRHPDGELRRTRARSTISTVLTRRRNILPGFQLQVPRHQGPDLHRQAGQDPRRGLGPRRRLLPKQRRWRHELCAQWHEPGYVPIRAARPPSRARPGPAAGNRSRSTRNCYPRSMANCACRTASGIPSSSAHASPTTNAAEHPFETGPGARASQSGPIWNGTMYPERFRLQPGRQFADQLLQV
jgi:iron complex outermembrane receptor protein